MLNDELNVLAMICITRNSVHEKDNFDDRVQEKLISIKRRRTDFCFTKIIFILFLLSFICENMFSPNLDSCHLLNGFFGHNKTISLFQFFLWWDWKISTLFRRYFIRIRNLAKSFPCAPRLYTSWYATGYDLFYLFIDKRLRV